MELSLPEIPMKTREELDLIRDKRELGKLCFETIRSFNISIGTVLNVSENSEEFKSLRRSIKFVNALGHLGKSLKLYLSVMALEEKHQDTVELLVSKIHQNSIKGLYYASASDLESRAFAERSLDGWGEKYKIIKALPEKSKSEEQLLKYIEELFEPLSLDPNMDFNTSFKLPSIEEIIKLLKLEETIVEQVINASLDSYLTDFTNILTKIVENKEGDYSLKFSNPRSSPVVLASSGIVTSLLMKKMCEEFFLIKEIQNEFAEYYSSFNKWFQFLYEYCRDSSLPGYEPVKQEKVYKRVPTSLKEHELIRKKIIPPLMKMENIELQSWTNDRMPEFFWVMLLQAYLGHDRTVSILKTILRFCGGKNENQVGVKFSEIADLRPRERKVILTMITASSEAKNALSCIELLTCVPAYEDWLPHIKSNLSLDEKLNLIKEAIVLSLDASSRESTTCRWFAASFLCVTGKIKFVKYELVKPLEHYPDSVESERRYGSLVRALEGGSGMMTKSEELSWIKIFWEILFKKTQCIMPPRGIPTQVATHILINSKTLNHAYAKFGNLYLSNIETTSLNTKQDITWGMGLYSLAIANEIIEAPESSALSLLGLRTLAELLINLNYLILKNDDELWNKFKDYGVGQAKLVVLKSREATEIPHYIPFTELEMLINEDKWEEYAIVDTGDWASENLRSRSIKGSIQKVYDNYYIWPSSFAHSQWGAIRFLNFENCHNPLHRFHRIPVEIKNLKTVKYDVEILLQEVFKLINDVVQSDDVSLLELLKSEDTSKVNEDN